MPRSVTIKESLRTLKSIFGKDQTMLGINWDNHKKLEQKEDTYRITMNVISLSPIIKLMDHKRVKNVWWHPSAAPPGTAIDAIALRYRLYVQYHKVATRRRKPIDQT